MGYNGNPAFDAPTDSNKITEQDSLDQKFLGETIVDDNLDNGTYYYYLDMNGFSELALQIYADATITVTVEAALRDDGTSQESLDYIDVTQKIYGTSTAITNTEVVLFDENKISGQTKFIRIKVVSTNLETNTVAIYAKRKY